MHIATCVWQEKAAAMGAAAGGRAGECRVSLVALLAAAGRALNCVVSFVVFSFLDVLDMVLCLVYKVVDYAVEAEWKPCYCSAAAREGGGGGGVAGGATGAQGALSFVAPRAEDAAGGRVGHALRARLAALGRHTEAGPHRAGADREPGHRRAHPGQDRPRATPAAAGALLVRLRLQDVPLVEHRLPRLPPLRARAGPAAAAAGGRRAGGSHLHPRLHLLLRVLDGDGVPGVQPGGARAVPDVRRGPAGVRAEPQAGRLAVHAAGAPGDDRALRAPALPPQVLPRRGALPRLRPRPRARRQVPRRRQVPHAPRPAVLPGAGGGGGGGDAVRDAAGGAAAGVAADRVRGVDGVLVRAREPDHLPHHLQAPPGLEQALQDLHQKQDEDVPDRGVHVPHPQRGVAHPAQHHVPQRQQDGRLPGRGRRAAELQGGPLPRPRRRAAPRGVHPRRRRPGAPGPRHRLRQQGPHHHRRRPGEALRRRARGHLAERRPGLAPLPLCL
uniref:Uncharacterized protein n=1 Tax=Aegilops tauschii subsp. strangulata TaxID=200361 RepID=A0A453QJ68_AEGTS